ncbi:MAG: SPOR domain-containing protein [Pseudomonadota bacterium]
MAQDFAKRRQSKTKTRRKSVSRSARNKPSAGGGWRAYFAGLVSGVFISFLLYLATLEGAGIEDPATGGKPSETKPPKPRFDFYTMLPEQSIEVEVTPEPVEPAADVSKPIATESDAYVLQAGSFRQREDADRRRAELLLLGLTPNVRETTGDNGRWFRVYLGPFETRSAMTRARGLTANQNIETLVLKRPRG